MLFEYKTSLVSYRAVSVWSHQLCNRSLIKSLQSPPDFQLILVVKCLTRKFVLVWSNTKYVEILRSFLQEFQLYLHVLNC